MTLCIYFYFFKMKAFFVSNYQHNNNFEFIQQMLNNKLVCSFFRNTYLKNYQSFSKRKGLEQNIKSKQSKKLQQYPHNQNANENLSELAKIKILNMQFFPITFLLTPTIFTYQTLFDPTFLLGELLAEKYASLALLLNLDLQKDKRKTAAILTLMASLHVLTGYYSLFTPFGMAFLTMVSPFKFCNEKEKYTESEQNRMRTMTHIRMAYFFLFTLLTIIKAYHYEATYSLDKKLDQFNEENVSAIEFKETI